MEKYNFTEADEIKSNWFQAKNIGDSLEGTYIGKLQQLDRLANDGRMQTVYEILTDDGSVWKVARRTIDDAMKRVKLGQIVQIIFTEVIKTKQPGKDDFKVIKVRTRADLFNNEWIQKQEANGISLDAQEMTIGEPENIDLDDIDLTKPEPIKKAVPLDLDEELTSEELLEKIRSIGESKLGLDMEDSVAFKKAIVEKTGLSFTATNLKKIYNLIK